MILPIDYIITSWDFKVWKRVIRHHTKKSLIISPIALTSSYPSCIARKGQRSHLKTLDPRRSRIHYDKPSASSGSSGLWKGKKKTHAHTEENSHLHAGLAMLRASEKRGRRRTVIHTHQSHSHELGDFCSTRWRAANKGINHRKRGTQRAQAHARH
jgi:hypothetical protein